MDGISTALHDLKQAKISPIRETSKISFGTIEECKQLFIEAFLSTDKTIDKLEWLPEYNLVVDWMHNNKGKGLCLRGDCGRGKSNILFGVLPVAFMMKLRKVLRVYQAEEIPENITDILRRKMIGLDEVGTESQCNDYGEKYEGFNRIINLAEKEIRLLFITTNLNKDEILDRYGVRTWERINRLCLVIHFKGNSLR